MDLDEQTIRRWEKSHRRGKVAGGLLLATIGALFLGRELGADLPAWLFTWKSLLIGIGVLGFIKHGFKRLGWLIPLLAGSAFLIADQYPELALRPLLWPLILILLGLVIAFKPRRNFKDQYMRKMRDRNRHFEKKYEDWKGCTSGAQEDFIDSTSVMGGVQKNILSKNFKGGDITNVFGGTEINLSQADFEGRVTLEITQVFGGTKLVIPANWEIQSSSMVTVMGSVEDKRALDVPTDPGKVLVLNGTTFMGGIEIRTF